MQKKIEYIYIQFLTVVAIEKLYKIFKPFLSNRYDDIFFEEKIQNGEDFTLYISNDEDITRIYALLEELDKNLIRYELYIYEPEWMEEMGCYFPNRIKITVEQFKKLELNYEELKKESRGFDFKINNFALSFDGKYIVTATQHSIFIWCAKTYKCLAQQIAWDGTAERVYFSSDSKYFITLITDEGSWQNTIQVWSPLEDTVTRWEWLQEDEFDLQYSKSEMRKLTPSLSYLFSSLDRSCYGGEYNFYREFYSLDFAYKIVYHEEILALYSMDKPLVDETCTLISEIEIHSELKALCFSHDCKYI